MLASTFYLIIAGVFGFSSLVAVGGGVFAFATKDARARKKLLEKYAPKKDRSLPQRVNEETDGLRLDVAKLLELKQFELAEKVSEVIRLTQNYFGRLKGAENTHQVNMAAVNYSDVLAKLNQALSDEYYFDMVQNPAMWTRVEERKALVHEVAESIATELTQAIRDFNSHADIHYDVKLESVLRRADASAFLEDLK